MSRSIRRNVCPVCKKQGYMIKGKGRYIVVCDCRIGGHMCRRKRAAWYEWHIMTIYRYRDSKFEVTK